MATRTTPTRWRFSGRCSSRPWRSGQHLFPELIVQRDLEPGLAAFCEVLS